jgi:hypothetical protein
MVNRARVQICARPRRRGGAADDCRRQWAHESAARTQNCERIANRARLVTLFEKSGRAQQADTYR